MLNLLNANVLSYAKTVFAVHLEMAALNAYARRAFMEYGVIYQVSGLFSILKKPI